MCPPKLYDVNYVINPWMDGNVHASSRTRAAEQWQRLYEAVSEIADVELVEPQPGSPDMVFTANAGLERNGIVAISSFFHPERQGEEPHFRRWFRASRLHHPRHPPRHSLRRRRRRPLLHRRHPPLGRPRPAHAASPATSALRDIWDIEVIPLHLIDPRFYHLDTCFAPLEGGYVMYFPEAFDHVLHRESKPSTHLKNESSSQRSDAVCFACNAINVGRTIILNQISSKLSSQLEHVASTSSRSHSASSSKPAAPPNASS